MTGTSLPGRIPAVGRVVVGLGGSRNHVLGASAGAEGAPALARSLLPSLLSGLSANLGIRSLLDGDASGHPDAPDAAVLSAVRRTAEALQGPRQRMEFVAKRLLHGPSREPDDDSIVLLGSPLYVALVD
ncbi:SAVMC3_10250 family protein [Streptomyces sp. NPDC005181]|uniref:DUF7019 family protein n=1 Tax=Streptomyces sp. NPDC005181 TaxID=3156869 RepID=UPI0033B1BE82